MSGDDTHGMNGVSATHCCYKHEYKDLMSNAATEHLRDIFRINLPDTFSNSFIAMDTCDAISEILEERGIDIYQEHGLDEAGTRLFTKGDNAEEL